MKPRDAFRLCCYPVEESRTIVYVFPFSLKSSSVVPVFEVHTNKDSQVRSGHPMLKCETRMNV